MFSRLCLLVFVLIGCVEIDSIKATRKFDPKSVAQISFRIEQDQKSQLDQFEASQMEDVSREISTRFAAVGYPIHSVQQEIARQSASAASDKAFTHQLQASAGSAALTQTPKGFTMDFGNSDVRALNFQKTTTVDIECRLVDLKGIDEPIVLSERKAIPASVAQASTSNVDDFERLRRYYVENMGATCHDLLTKLDIYPTEPAEPIKQGITESGAWGDIRIQTEYEQEGLQAKPSMPPSKTPKTVKAAKVVKSTKPQKPRAASTVAPKGTPGSSQGSVTVQAPDRQMPGSEPAQHALPVDTELPDESPQLVEPEQDYAEQDAQTSSEDSAESQTTEEGSPAPVITEVNKTGDWRKKRIKIFNQDSTVILKFGPDR